MDEDYLDFDPPGYQMGQWGYQVLNDRARKVKKNPIGFAVPLEPKKSEDKDSDKTVEESSNI